MDRIVRVEDIPRELPKVLSILNVPMPYALSEEWTNATQHNRYECYYDKEDRDFVEKLFAFDIEVGKYTYTKKMWM